MPIPVRKDSWSKCENPSMLYDAVKNPNAVFQPKKAVTEYIPKDSIETKQQRLNREMFQKMQSHTKVLPHDTYVVVAQVGKYLFMAVMLPPYIFLYGIPKWLLVNVFPLVFEVTKSVSYKIGNMVSEASKRVIDLMKGALAQMLGDALRIIKEKTGKFFQFVNQKRQALSHALNEIFKKNRTALKKGGRKLAEVFTKPFSLIRKTLQNFTKMTHAKAAMLKQKIAGGVKKAKKKISIPIRKPMREKLMPHIERVMSYTKTANEWLKKAERRVIKPVKKMINKVVAPTREVARFIQKEAVVVLQGIQNIIQPWIVWGMPRLEAFINLFKRSQAAVAKTVQQLNKAASNHIGAGANFIKQHIAQRVNKILNYLHKITGKDFKKQFQSFDFARRFSPFKKAYKTVATALKHSIVYTSGVIKTFFEKVVGWLKQAIKKIRQFLIFAPVQFVKAVKKGSHVALTALGRFADGLRLSIAFLFALTRYAMESVHDVTRQLFNDYE